MISVSLGYLIFQLEYVVIPKRHYYVCPSHIFNESYSVTFVLVQLL